MSTDVLPPAPTPPNTNPPPVEALSGIITWLSGKKSYIIGVLIVAVVIAQAAGLLNSDQAQKILEALGGTSILTLRAAIAKQQ